MVGHFVDPYSPIPHIVGQRTRPVVEHRKDGLRLQVGDTTKAKSDEIEKAFASAAARSEDGGLSQRMFGRIVMCDGWSPAFRQFSGHSG